MDTIGAKTDLMNIQDDMTTLATIPASSSFSNFQRFVPKTEKQGVSTLSDSLSTPDNSNSIVGNLLRSVPFPLLDCKVGNNNETDDSGDEDRDLLASSSLLTVDLDILEDDGSHSTVDAEELNDEEDIWGDCKSPAGITGKKLSAEYLDQKRRSGHGYLSTNPPYLQEKVDAFYKHQVHLQEQQEQKERVMNNLKNAAVSLPSHDVSRCASNAAVLSVPNGIDSKCALHRACQLFPRKVRMVKAAMKLDPGAIHRKAFIKSLPSQTQKHQDAIHKTTQARHKHLPPATPEPFQLPINIALYHNASLQVLDFLVQADPSQLSVLDGMHGINSLFLALDRRPNDIACLGLLLVSNPNCAKLVCGFRKNTPLHFACQKGASLQVIRSLVQIYPSALFKRNEYGLLPVDIAKRQLQLQPVKKTVVTTSDSSNGSGVMDFLMEKAKQYQESYGMAKDEKEGNTKQQDTLSLY